MNGHEQGASREERFDPVLERAHDKALAYISRAEIRPDRFRGASADEDEQISRDQEKVSAIKAQFGAESRGRKMARIFEALVCDLSSSYVLPGDRYRMPQPGWFGYRGSAIKTSEYDDFLNHTDLVLEFDGGPKDPRRVQIAVDLTFGESDATVQKKLATAHREAADGHGRQLRYFESDKTGKKRNISRLPSAVLGVDYSRVSELARLWVSESPSDEKELRSSPVRKVIAAELLAQVAEHRGSLERRIREHPEQAPDLEELRNNYKLAQTFVQNFFDHVSGAAYRNGEDTDAVFKKIAAGRKEESRAVEERGIAA